MSVIDLPELIVFCDGSPLAMSAVAYIRWSIGNDEYSNHLIAAKTKVTPLKRITIPRAELQAAVIAVRLSNSIIKESRYEFKSIYYISDSECTLASLRKDSTALKEFFGNRVAEINASTSVSQWYHCRSQFNIADLATRLSASRVDIQEDSEWQIGPKWLYQDRKSWPISQKVPNGTVPCNELIKQKVCCLSANRNVCIDIERFSSYDLLMNVTARLFSIFASKSFCIKDILSCF